VHSLEDQGLQLLKDKRFKKINSIAHNVTVMHIVLVVGVLLGHSQLHQKLCMLDELGNCLIRLAITNHKDCHFKFQHHS
jgi:hypothetical protein